MFKHKAFIFLIIAAFIIRVIASFWSFGYRENTDVLRYKDWGRIAFLHGLADTYQPDHLTFGTLPNNQPPGSLYIISSSYFAHLQAAKVFIKTYGQNESSNAFIVSQVLPFFLRIPQILADLAIGIVLYIVARHAFNQKHGLITASLFLFHPGVIYNSAVWGQMDSLNNLFFLLSLYSLYKKKVAYAIGFFACSLFIKVSLVFLIPMFLLFLLNSYKKNLKEILTGTVISFFIILLATLPISTSPISWLIKYAQINSLGEMQHITNFAFNFWWMIYHPTLSLVSNTDIFSFSEIRLSGSPLDSSTFLGIPLHLIGLTLFLVLSLPLYHWIMTKKVKNKQQYIFLLFALSALLGFIFLPRMHERYMYPVFPLLAMSYGVNKKFIYEYIGLGILYILNLYFVWHPMRISLLNFNTLNNHWFQWSISLCIVLISAILYIRVIRMLQQK